MMELQEPQRATERDDTRRLCIRLTGAVQGVGFRPYLYRLAQAIGVTGFVRNDTEGVVVEVEGAADELAEFMARLPREAPRLARIDCIAATEQAPSGGSGFSIIGSAVAGSAHALVAPDAATCDACIAELFDPANRRYRYPFINCTNCGPRFTIVLSTPYDRASTTMRRFPMCALCRREYEDPADRRFHAEPNACPRCGPQVTLVHTNGRSARGDVRPDPSQLRQFREDAVRSAVALLLDNHILAIKGIGGYHLACRADNNDVVTRLRRAKQRQEKPFALMVMNLEAAAALVDPGEEEAALLSASERPIVLARRRDHAKVAPAVAMGAGELGLMLPYSPLHHLLLADVGLPLVMTSGNISDEPIAYRDHDALERLGAIADAVLLHDRPIHTRTDDSVVRVIQLARSGAASHGATPPAVAGNAEQSCSTILRRSRGYAPLPLDMPMPGPAVLACGAEQKGAFCISAGRRAFLSQHIGDLKNYETFESFTTGVEHFTRLFRIKPEVVAHDLHPDYLSTRFALERTGLKPMGVQHHHAHFAACLAEHGEQGSALGVIYDGTGYGTDGTIWGGELLLGDLRTFRRVGHIATVRMPGGAAAIREPWRMACAWMQAIHGARSSAVESLRQRAGRSRWDAVERMVRKGVAAPLTSSAGRLLDAAAALCGIRTRVSYEGQAAIEFEQTADPGEQGAYDVVVDWNHDVLLLNPEAAFMELLADLERGARVATMAARFHNALADATVRACARLAEVHGQDVVVLSGGVFQNVLLLRRIAAGLCSAGLRVLLPQRVPVNDGGIAYGQAAIAAARSS